MNEEKHIIRPSICQLFEQVAASYPTNSALIFGKTEISCAELGKKVNRLSESILRNTTADSLVGISSSRRLVLVVGLLAILKAGKDYLPLNPSYPKLRLIQIIANSGITSCLAMGNDAALFTELGVKIVFNEGSKGQVNKPPAAAPSDATYVLYTSGSTGEPKSVRMGQAPLLNLLRWQNRHSRAGAGTRTLQFAPLSFDVSFQEIFATLSTGGTLVLLGEEQLDFDNLLLLIEEQGINRLFLPFVALQALAEMAVSSQRFPACLREVMTAGEQLKITPQVAAFFAAIPECVLYNQYGPTECHVVTQLRLAGPPAAWPPLPSIGQPIDNVTIYVLDKQLGALPAGEVGEICIGGACLADGYVNQPALTQEKFVRWQGVGAPAAVRLYRTGDLGRYLPDGTIEFLGRQDDQVKIRGHCIELGEVEIGLTKLYQFPTAAGIAHYLAQRPEKISSPQPEYISQITNNQGDIAVIGMASRFPGATTPEELWAVLQQGRETISFFTEEELDATIPASLKNDPLYVKARGVLADVEQFDAAFFGLSPKLAAAMDPQQRVFLEIAWEALGRAGYLPPHYGGRVGVFAGSGNNTYYLRNVLTDPETLRQLGDFQAMVFNEKDYIASRTAYHLNLTGPAVSVYSACSTSLLAITQAVQSLRSGQCEVALAGGASITPPVRSGHLYQDGAMLSRDGHSRSFGAGAQGTVFSDGAGVVLLKSLAAARRDGDAIYAVIKGVGVTNDGAGKGSFTAPSAEGQAGAIRQALADARCDPATISYVEAHGPATPLGNPIELEGLALAFGAHVPQQSCAIGSIKSAHQALGPQAAVVHRPRRRSEPIDIQRAIQPPGCRPAPLRLASQRPQWQRRALHHRRSNGHLLRGRHHGRQPGGPLRAGRLLPRGHYRLRNGQAIGSRRPGSKVFGAVRHLRVSIRFL